MHTSSIPVGGMHFNVAQEGKGPALLLVHGFPLDHSMWSAQLETLSSKHRVIAPDLRGFGQTGGGSDTTWRMEQYADDLARLLDTMKITDPVIYCGLSMGGYIGWQFATRHRQRVSRLIMCDTRSVADTPDAAKARLANADKVMVEGTQFIADGMLPKLFAPETFAEQPELIEATKQVILRAPRQGVAAALRGMAERPDFTPVLLKVDVPTIVIGGEKDQIAPPEEMQAIARAIPGASYHEIKRAGHMAPLEKPREFNEIVAGFLG